MSDPQDPRGEASGPDASQPEAPRAESSRSEAADTGVGESSADHSEVSASIGTAEASEGSGEQAWPTEDEAAEAVGSPATAQDGGTEDGATEDGATDDATEGGAAGQSAAGEHGTTEEAVSGDGPKTTPVRATSAGPGSEGPGGSGAAEGPVAHSASGELDPTPPERDSSDEDTGDGWPTDEQATLATGTAPEAGVEGTQQIPRVEETQRIPKVEPGTDRFDQSGPAQSGPTQPQQAPPEPTQQIPRVEETQRIPKVDPAASPRAVEQPTEQFSPVDVGGSPTEQQRSTGEQGSTGEQRFAEPYDFDEYAEPSSTGASAQEQPPLPPHDGEPGDDRRDERPRRRRRGLIAVALVAVVVLGVGIVVGTGGFGGISALRTPSPPPPVRLDPAIKPAGNGGAVPQEQGVNAALSGPLANPALGSLGGTVVDAQTGRLVWQRDGGQAKTPASTGKLLATSASLLALDQQQRFSTKVVRGSEPGSVVLVGGGDPTLSSLPAGKDSVYPGAAHLDDLAAQVKAATGGQVSSIKVDTSRYKGPPMAPGWMDDDVAGGSTAPIEPVMVDGARANPNQDQSPRSKTPSLQAGQKLAERLGVPSSSVSGGTAPGKAPQLGEVQSATVQQMVETALRHSDNVLTEALAREVAVSTGNEPSFAGASKAVRDVLAREGFPLEGTAMLDGSGLSPSDRTTPEGLAKLLAAASAPEAGGDQSPKTRKLRSLLSGLPVAGGVGSLEDRFQGSPGRGWVRGKTGTLNNANSLAGTVLTQDGRLLVFSFLTNGTTSTSARPALDEVASALRGCGCR